jgi:hypothetical protein
MNELTNIDLITGYLQGSLNSSDNEELQKRIDGGKLDISELIAFQTVYNDLDNVKIPEPGPGVSRRFYAMLESGNTRHHSAYPTASVSSTGWMQQLTDWFRFRSFGLAVAILLIGMLFGDLLQPFSRQDKKIDQLTSEISMMREIMMMSLLENDSPVERLRAVNISTEITESDSRVAEALLYTLNSDPNVNVRIAAVDALVFHASDPAVRRSLIDSITRQESPLVQVALADAMIELQERDSVTEFVRLLERNDIHSNVRDKIENTILALN